MIKRFSQILFICLLVLNVGLAIYYLSEKKGWHIDEQYSYGHANSTQGAYLSDDIVSYFVDKETDLHNRWLDGKVFHDYLTTQDDERFHYQHIWHNLQRSVHPPLFYVLLHTICSFFPDVLSPWQAGSINLIAFLLALIMLYKLAKLFIKDDYLAMVPVFVWGFSEAGLTTALFLRMYMLQALFAICLLYEICLLLIENKADRKRLFLIFLYSTLGILTQYTSIIFSFVVAGVTCVILFWRRHWKLLFYFSLMMLLSMAVLFIVFPPAIDVLFFSYRGQEVAYKYHNFSISDWVKAYIGADVETQLFNIYFDKLFGVYRAFDFTLYAIIIFYVGLLLIRKKKINSCVGALFFITLVLSMYLYFFMPVMYVFKFRYYMFLMPVVTILIIFFIVEILTLSHVPMVRSLLLIFMVACSLFSQIHFKQNIYCTPITEDTERAKDMLKDKRIIVMTSKEAFDIIFDLAVVWANSKNIYWAFDNKVALTALDEADYMLIYNSFVRDYAGDRFSDKYFLPIPVPNQLSAELADKLQFLMPFRNGIINFDLYEVKH